MKASVELERDGDSEMFEDLERYLKYHPGLTRFLFNPAGFTFIFGVILYLGMLVGWAGLLMVDAGAGRDAGLVALTQITGGREVSIPVGLELGLPVLLVAGIVFMQDLVTTSWVYPAFYLFRKRNVNRENFAGYFFQRMEKKAAQHRPFIERYGAVGLFFFMLIPFAINGPLIGAILGKLAGIRTRYILPTVVLATFVSTAIWAALYHYARAQMEDVAARVGGTHWIALAMLGVLLVVLLVTFFGFLKDIRRYRAIRERREALARAQHVAQTLHATEATAGRRAAERHADEPQ